MKIKTFAHNIKAKIKAKAKKIKTKVSDKAKASKAYVKGKVSLKNNNVYGFIKSLDFIDEGNTNLKYSKAVIFALLVFSWFILNLLYNYISYIQNLSFANLLGIPIAIVSFLVIALLIYFLINDIIGVITLNEQQSFRNKVNKLITDKNINGLKNALLNHKLTTSKLKKKLSDLFAGTEDEKAIIENYENLILKQTDKEIDAVINKYAGLSSAANLISSKMWLDFLITQIIFSRMLIDIAKIYRIKLGLCSFFKLMLAGLMGVSVSALTTNLIGKLVKKIPIIGVASDIVIPALVMKQLGLKIKYTIRPIEARNSSTFKKDELKLEKELSTKLEELPETIK
ncbi:MAG: YcjF family protein [Lactobacillaceae bacterium]|jgi:uncharacterized membrane protein YcjF (UPF0283 family)|nr:YcjF family protein [Lactobacillaceae bacterium]